MCLKLTGRGSVSRVGSGGAVAGTVYVDLTVGSPRSDVELTVQGSNALASGPIDFDLIVEGNVIGQVACLNGQTARFKFHVHFPGCNQLRVQVRALNTDPGAHRVTLVATPLEE